MNKNKLKSKRGFVTLISIISLLLIIFSFIVFAFLFSHEKNKSDQLITSAFSSLDKEITLMSFLNSNSGVKENDLLISKNYISIADLISKSCDFEENGDDEIIKTKSLEFFNRVYGEKNWNLDLIYYVPSFEPETGFENFNFLSVGSANLMNTKSDFIESEIFKKELVNQGNYLETSVNSLLFKLNLKEKSVASQILPCEKDSTIVKVVLLVLKQPEGAEWK